VGIEGVVVAIKMCEKKLQRDTGKNKIRRALQSVFAAALVVNYSVISARSQTEFSINTNAEISLPKVSNDISRNALYRIDISCERVGRLLPPARGIFSSETDIAAHTIALVKGAFLGTSIPAVADTLFLYPIYAVTSGETNRSLVDSVRDKCRRTFFVSGRDLPSVVATWTFQASTNPSTLTKVLLAIASAIVPLAPLFGGGVGPIATTKLGPVVADQQPLTTLLSIMNVSNTTLSSKFLVESSQPTVITTPLARVSLLVTRIKSLQDKGNEQYLNVFEKTFDALSVAISKPTDLSLMQQTCAAVAQGLSFDQNLNVEDVAYAMSHAVVLAGFDKPKIVQCLGGRYGRIAIKQAFWLSQKISISEGEFPTIDFGDVIQPPFSQSYRFFQQLAVTLTKFANATDPVPDEIKNDLQSFFATKSVASQPPSPGPLPPAGGQPPLPSPQPLPQPPAMSDTRVAVSDTRVRDYIDLTSAAVTHRSETDESPLNEKPFEGGAIKIFEDLKKQQYKTFGCVSSDSAIVEGTTNANVTAKGAAAVILALKNTAATDGKDKKDTPPVYKDTDAIAIRLWVNAKLPRQIDIVELDPDGATIGQILAAAKNRCTLNAVVQAAKDSSDTTQAGSKK
jgi:hypothetical protein